MKINDFIKTPVRYDEHGSGYFFGNDNQMIADMRGWGAIQQMFRRNDRSIDEDSAAKFQDEVGRFIADAINEKMERDKLNG